MSAPASMGLGLRLQHSPTPEMLQLCILCGKVVSGIMAQSYSQCCQCAALLREAPDGVVWIVGWEIHLQENPWG